LDTHDDFVRVYDQENATGVWIPGKRWALGDPGDANFALFPTAFIVFGVAFWISVRTSGLETRWVCIAALGAQSLAVLVMSFVCQSFPYPPQRISRHHSC